MVTHHLQKLARSFRPEATARRIGDVPADTPIRLTILLKPQAPLDASGPTLSRADYAKRHGTRQDVVDRLVAYAQSHGLTVEHADAATHTVKLSGSYAQAQSAFEPEGMGLYDIDGRHVIARSGHLAVPPDLAEHVTAVMGFDQRPVAKPHFRVHPRAAAATVSYDPAAVAVRYDFPTTVTGVNQTIALIELGGGYDAAQMSAYFAVYFGNNAGSGFLDTVSAAVHDAQRAPSVISISWGGPENQWAAQDIDAMDQVFQAAATLGITVTAASGDDGASDGEQGTLTVDFPAASPYVLGCGGTKLPRQGAETAWNDGAQGGVTGGATGGGFSTHFNRPAWQSGNTRTGRGVPDVAGNADPATGYNVTVDGQDTVIGGTSAVAPLWAGLIALVNQSTGGTAGFVNPALYANASAMTDIVSGDNDGFRCAPGWDPVTGLGSPKGNAVLAALKSGRQAVA
jgi:kumamolisin